DYFINECARIFRVDHLVAISINDLALHVHHVVKIEGPFSDQIVPLFDPLLCCLDRFVQPAMLKLLSFLQAKSLHDLVHSVGRAKVAHQIVFEADIETRCTGVALSRATATKLTIYPARLMTFGSQHEQAVDLRYAWTEFNVRPATGHVR